MHKRQWGWMLLVACALAQADSTELDQTFGTQGLSSLIDGDNSATLAHFPAPNGGSVAVLYYRQVGGTCPSGKLCLGIRRFSASGGITTAYASPSLNFDFINGAAIDSVGRIVVAGSTLVSGVDQDFRVVRLTPAGIGDLSFSGDGMRNIAFDLGGNNVDRAFAVAVDARDRIVVVGLAQRADAGDTDFAVARLRSDGLIDTSFGSGGTGTIAFDLGASNRGDVANAVVIGRDGKMLIGGEAFDSAVSVTRIAITRLLDNGQIDASYCSPTCNFTYPSINSGRRIIYYGQETPAQNDTLASMAIDPNGTLYTAGTTPGPMATRSGYLQRFSANGAWEAEVSTTASIGGQVVIGAVHSINSVANETARRIVLTGVTGANRENFFTQRFDRDLNPRLNAGNQGASNSVYLWSGTNFADAGGNLAAQSSIDRSDASFPAVASNQPQRATRLRRRWRA
jgi:uncharacterized delta-60 repeat protein